MEEAEGYLGGRSRETTLWRDRAGQWFDGEQRIRHRGVARAFDRWLERAPDGRYRLRNAVNWAYVRIEGSPYFVRQLKAHADALWLTLSDGSKERLDPQRLSHREATWFFAEVKQGSAEAQFDRHCAQRLADYLRLEGEAVLLDLGGQAYPLASRT